MEESHLRALEKDIWQLLAAAADTEQHQHKQHMHRRTPTYTNADQRNDGNGNGNADHHHPIEVAVRHPTSIRKLPRFVDAVLFGNGDDLRRVHRFATPGIFVIING